MHFKHHFGQRELTKHITPKKINKKNVCTLILGAIFVKSKHIQQVWESVHIFFLNFPRLCPDFKEFFQDFHKNKSYGGAPATSSPPTPLLAFSLLGKPQRLKIVKSPQIVDKMKSILKSNEAEDHHTLFVI